jgi:hypothetical protein
MRYFLLALGLSLGIELCLLIWVAFHGSMGADNPERIARESGCCSCMVVIDPKALRGGAHGHGQDSSAGDGHRGHLFRPTC